MANTTKKTKTTKKTTAKKSTTKKPVAKKPANEKVVEDKAVETVVETPVVEETVVETAPTTETPENDSTKKSKAKKSGIFGGLFNKSDSTIKAPKIINQDKKTIATNKNKKVDIVRFEANPKTGLTQEQVNQRIAEKLINKQKNKATKSYFQIILGNVLSFFNILCFFVFFCLISVGSWSNCFFMVIVSPNIGIGIVQEIRAKKTIEKINIVTSPTAKVIRDSTEFSIPVDDIVLDEIMVLSTGKQISADCIVIEGSVEVNESLLTGESVPIKKVKGDLLYSGSFVVSGNCKAQVEKIAGDTYTAQLSSKAKKYKKPKSELLGSMRIIMAFIGVIIIPLAVLMYMNNYDASLDTATAISKTAGSIIAMIPAGMFLLTSMALATGVVKLARRRTLVQDLYSIEMLARTDVLCLDKTGTITDGTMKVNTVIQLENNLSNTINNIVGSMLTALSDNNQTSRALANHFGYSKELLPSVILPFSSSRKLSAVTFKNGETFIYGAPEYVLKTKDPQVDKLVKQYASAGFRVLLIASGQGAIQGDKLPEKRKPVAIIVIEDHIREDAPATIEWFKKNGVAIKIISGDNPVTVSEVSRRSLEGLNEQQVIESVEKYTVFGRVSPEQKCILVKALKNKGHKVAMTGDGVNDILALKEADCSIAMASGSEATRHVSNLVLLDSNFSSMPSVVAEGRRVVNNVQKSSSLFLMKTIYAILLSVFFLILQEEYPFTPSNLYLLEYFVIGIPSFFLALQPNTDQIKGRFLNNVLAKSLPGAIIFSIDVIICFLFRDTLGLEYQTVASLTIFFSGLLILMKVCSPFDAFRGLLYACMVGVSIITLLVLPPTFFGYVEGGLLALSFQNQIFIIALIQLTYSLYASVVKLCDKLTVVDTKKEVTRDTTETQYF